MSEEKKNRTPRTTKEVLDAEEKVTLTIPRGENESREAVMISINDINYMIKFDEPVEVPESVARAWNEKLAAERRSRKYMDDMNRQMKEKASKSGGGVY